MGIVDRIRTLCEEKGITINKLEKETSIGRGNIARWDKHRPNIDNVQKVADYFAVTTDYILTGNENKPTQEGELTDAQREAMELVMQMSDDQLKIFIATLKAAKGETI